MGVVRSPLRLSPSSSPSVSSSSSLRGRLPLHSTRTRRRRLSPSPPSATQGFAPQEDAQALLLTSSRTLFISNELDALTAEATIASLLYLDNLAYPASPSTSSSSSSSSSTTSSSSSSSSKEIKLFINSPGGPVNPAMGLLDTMNYVRSPIKTIAVGLVASSAAFPLAAGTPGLRLSMPNARIMIHQPLGDAGGFASEFETATNEMMFHKSHMSSLLASLTGQSVSKVDEDTDRDLYMSAIQAKEYGIIDEIIGGSGAVYQMEEKVKEWVLDQDLWTPDRQYEDDPERK